MSLFLYLFSFIYKSTLALPCFNGLNFLIMKLIFLSDKLSDKIVSRIMCNNKCDAITLGTMYVLNMVIFF